MKYANFYQKQFKTENQWAHQISEPKRQKNSIAKDKLLEDFVLNLNIDSLIKSDEIKDIDVQKYKYDAYIANSQFQEDENKFYDQVRSRKATSNSPLQKNNKIAVTFNQEPINSPRLIHTEQHFDKRKCSRLQQGSPYRRPTFKRKNMAALDNLIEIHFLIKMYQDSLKLKENFSMHNRLIILNSIWTKLMLDEGRLQTYIKFLYKEIMELIICKDSKILQVIEQLHEANKNTFQQSYISYCDAIEIIISQTEDLLQSNKNEDHKVKEEIKHINSQINEQSKQIKALKEIEQQLITNYEKQIKIQKSEFSEKQHLKEQDIRDLAFQLQEMKEDSYRIKNRNDIDKLSIQQKYEKILQEFLDKIQQLESQIGQLEEENKSLYLKLNEYQHKFQTAFHSLKIAKDRIKDAENAKEQFHAENSYLAVRAATSFDELTPRPDLDKLLNLLNLSSSQTKIQNQSTREKVEKVAQILEKRLSKNNKKKESLQSQISSSVKSKYQRQKSSAVLQKQNTIASTKFIQGCSLEEQDELDLSNKEENQNYITQNN